MAVNVLNILEDARGGGIVKRVIKVSKNIDEEKIKTVVLFPTKQAEALKKELNKNEIYFYQKRIHHLTYDPIELVKYLLNFVFEIYTIIKIIKKEQIDIVHCNGSWQFKGIIAACFTKAKSVWHLNDTYQNRIILILFKFLVSLTDAFIVASDRSRWYYGQTVNIEQKPVKLIEAPINCKEIKSNDEKFEEIEQFKGIKITTVGHINPNKGIETLVKTAFEVKKKTGEEVHFFIVGKVFDSQNGYYKKVKGLIKTYEIDNIHFLGYQKNITSILNSSDIYLCTSDNEASPTTVWEAMAAGKPVVSTDVSDVKLIFKAENCGLVAEVKDTEQLADHLMRFMENSKLKEEMADAAQKVSKEMFDINKIAEKYRDFYFELYQK